MDRGVYWFDCPSSGGSSELALEKIIKSNSLALFPMCGILAIHGKNVLSSIDPDPLLATLDRRGPEDRGVLRFAACLLGQTRLSIIDIAGGHQPMKDQLRNQAITFNGEIYNYRELRRTLEAQGSVFATDSDTEVILKVYQVYGTACVEHLDGMFAFALWDEDQKVLFLARDRFGKKPLYYAHDLDGNLYVASEIKALLRSGVIKGRISDQALDAYLTLMYLPPWQTIYENVHTLPPASYAIQRDGRLEIKRYWRLEKRPLVIGYDEAKAEVKRLLSRAVQKRLVADVEIGSFLSGGVDSTLVTLLAQSFLPQPIKTFSLGYQDYINELPFAREAADKIGSDHRTLQATDDMVGELRAVMAYYDEPHADSSDFPQHLLSRFAASQVKVALAGDGADELFLGYGWHTRHLNLSYRHHFFEKVFGDPFSGFLKNIEVFSRAERKRLLGSEAGSADILSEQLRQSTLSSVEKINLFDFTTYLPGQLLTKADRMGMMHSLEVRSPFLDRELVEFAYNLPTEYKATRTQSKIILKEILAETMPLAFVYRRKQGFGAPVRTWLKQPSFQQDVQTVLGSSQAELYRRFDRAPVKRLLKRFYEKGDDRGFYGIWILYCLELWLQSHAGVHVFSTRPRV